MTGTLDMGGVYGPAAGQQVSTRASTAPSALSGAMDMPFGFAALIALGFMAWYVLEKWD